jgi:cytochrome c-type biogenesis protein
MNPELSVLAAFIAGLLSFLSPCVLPLIPSYLSFLSGVEADGLANQGSGRGKTLLSSYNWRLIRSTLCFIAGFTVVFVALNILVAGSVLLLGGLNRIINIAAGILLIILGLNMLANFIPFLNYEKRFHPAKQPRRMLGSFTAGLAFGAGWTPCIGPILGSILVLASQESSLSRSILYLSVYSLGLGLPFLLSAVLWGSFLKYLAHMRRFLPVVKTVSGCLIIAIGLAIALGAYGSFVSFFTNAGYSLGAWAADDSLSRRLIPAAVFIALGLLPLVHSLLRYRRPPPLGALFFLGIFGVLGLTQALGVLNAAALLSRWFFFQGI